jgi:hypothetical protein
MEDGGISFERAAYFGLLLPSHSVALVKHAGGRSAPLPTWCDVCEKMINDYPFIAKHSSYRKDHIARRRKYHLDCALRIGLVSLVPMKA